MRPHDPPRPLPGLTDMDKRWLPPAIGSASRPRGVLFAGAGCRTSPCSGRSPSRGSCAVARRGGHQRRSRHPSRRPDRRARRPGKAGVPSCTAAPGRTAPAAANHQKQPLRVAGPSWRRCNAGAAKECVSRERPAGRASPCCTFYGHSTCARRSPPRIRRQSPQLRLHRRPAGGEGIAGDDQGDPLPARSRTSRAHGAADESPRPQAAVSADRQDMARSCGGGGKGRFGVSPYRRRGGQVSVLGRRLPLGLVPPDVTADRFGRRSVGGSLR